ncbi:hypothetical protein FisN_27Hh046 [Fistulifera solaris]|uniref:PPM-type phosphatase domain-containing protein n=1 Tax=Fistulifera solaris TaxID=1519565 RepID=A0A1Z5KPU9_FISSO|nr:hypothetical protein FisN_27Hh046 [Fistulifera solaris]|eukprot:GAX28299.1 hypothetical protein FisN_27Hh046 [Fistulifera solaris]
MSPSTFLAFFFLLVGVSSRNDDSYLLLPRDLAFDSTTRLALQSLRQSPDTPFLYLQSLFPHHSLGEPYWNHTDYGTLALVGSKGGHVLEQINQDRSFVWLSSKGVLSGVMDGHGTAGHFVAEYARHDLLQRFLNATSNDIEAWLHEAFLQTDHAIPDDLAQQGGCTCSLVYQNGERIYFANTGDSQSFLAAALSTGIDEMQVQIMYETRLDKPGHPDEARRLQHAGAQVTPETAEDDARVWATDPTTGHTSGLAMSRVLGDRQHTAVIADPIIQVIDLKAMKEKVLQEYDAYRTQQCQQVTIHADGSIEPCPLAETPEAVHFFVVSATDGVMDFLKPIEIAQTMAGYLYGNQGHPYLGMEDLLWQSTQLWQQHGQYRDDMAIAYAKTVQV